MLELQGRAALSAFRITKLLVRLQALDPRVQSLSSDYVHFVDTAPLDGAAQLLLARLLTYGPAPRPEAARAAAHTEVLLVVPRAGTISPWSSKATDIAQVCGLGAVRRIERGIRYQLEVSQALEPGARDRLAAQLFDRMTEMVVADSAGAEQLFARHTPRPLRRVALNGGRQSLEAAMRNWGWHSHPMKSATCWTRSRGWDATRPMPN